MKRTRKLILWAVLAAYMLSLSGCPAAHAELPSLFIPSRVERLELPEMPEVPEMPEPPAFHCWMDLIDEGADCPKIADPDGDFHLQFERQVECDVDGEDVPIDETGYGDIPAEMTEMQEIDITVTDGDMEYRFRAPDTLRWAIGRFGDLTVWYDENGCAYRMILKGNTDYFRSGMEGAVSQICFTGVVLETKIPVGRKYRIEKTRVWYVSSVRVDYPKGNTIRAAMAFYFNDKKNTLDSYAVGYDVTEEDRYAVYYSGHAYRCGGDVFAEDQILRGVYQDKGEDDLLTIDVNSGEVLSGRLYENASGKYFGSARWIDCITKKPYKGRKQLKRLFDFPSPRVK